MVGRALEGKLQDSSIVSFERNEKNYTDLGDRLKKSLRIGGENKLTVNFGRYFFFSLAQIRFPKQCIRELSQQ